MAHNLEEQANGQFSYIGKEVAWHGLGVVTGELMTYEEIQKHCLNWGVYKEQLRNHLGGTVPLWGVYRSDNHAFLGKCSEKSTIIKHDTGFEYVAALLDNPRCFETAGVLGKGEVVWGLGALPESRLGEDITKNFLLFTKSYDQSISNLFKLVRTRVVCNNTHTVALRESGFEVKVKNTKNSERILKNRIQALEAITGTIQTVDKQLELLVSKKANREYIDTIMRELFPLTVKEDESGKKVLVSPTRRTNMVDSILECYEKNDGDVFPEQRGTALNLFNAVTDWVDHVRSTRDDDEENKNSAAMFGSGDKLKSTAFSLIVDTAAQLPTVASSQQLVFLPAN